MNSLMASTASKVTYLGLIDQTSNQRRCFEQTGGEDDREPEGNRKDAVRSALSLGYLELK